MSDERTDLRVADAFVSVEGILSEKKLEQVKDNNGKNVIRGNLVLKIDDTNFITLNVYVSELTNRGETNKAYNNMSIVLNEYKSIADFGEEEADCIRCTKGNLQPNTYINKDDFSVQTNVRYTASFLSRATNNYNPHAEFTVEGYINTMNEEINDEGESTGRLIISLYVPTYKGVEPLKIIASEEYADDFMAAFEAGQTTKFYGEINNRTIVNEKVIKMAVGGSRTEVSRTYINELNATGADLPYDEDDPRAFSINAIKQGLVERDLRLDKEKADAESKRNANVAALGRVLPKFTL